MGSKSAETSLEPSYRSKLAQWAFFGGTAVVGASRFVAEKTQLPEWTWMLMLGVGSAGCASGAVWAFDGLKLISVSATKTEILKRALHLVILSAILAAVTLFLVFRLPSAAQTTGPKPALEVSPPSTSAPTSMPSAAPSVVPAPAPDLGVGAPEIVLLYENETRTLCGQPQLTVRQSARSGWVLYSKDFLAKFKEQPLIVRQAIKIGNCELVLTNIESNPLRFDFEMRWAR